MQLVMLAKVSSEMDIGVGHSSVGIAVWADVGAAVLAVVGAAAGAGQAWLAVGSWRRSKTALAKVDQI